MIKLSKQEHSDALGLEVTIFQEWVKHNPSIQGINLDYILYRIAEINSKIALLDLEISMTKDEKNFSKK